ncbi:MAG: hypothetical protein QXO91_03535 [Desulfurococcaceae archaeon]
MLELIQLAMKDPYLRNVVIRTVVQRYREDVRKLLGVSLPGIRLEWTNDFEEFLREHKKRKKVKDPETLKYYRSLFKRYIEGRELDEELVEYVIKHENKWFKTCSDTMFNTFSTRD